MAFFSTFVLHVSYWHCILLLIMKYLPLILLLEGLHQSNQRIAQVLPNLGFSFKTTFHLLSPSSFCNQDLAPAGLEPRIKGQFR